jgi:2-oxoglutarate ferredoxin oxidoreductase subunit beta
MDQGFSVIECLSEGRIFPGRLDPAILRRAQLRGDQERWDNARASCGTTSPTSSPHAARIVPLHVGVFYETDRPTKNSLEKKWIENTRKIGNPEVLRKPSTE